MVEKTEVAARADSACRASDLTVDDWQQAYLDETSRLEAQLAERVKVKALDWKDNSAQTAFGNYLIVDHGGYSSKLEERYSLHIAGENMRPMVLASDCAVSRYPDFVSAKAAAQSDFDRRILSALVFRTRDANPVASHETANVEGNVPQEAEVVGWLTITGGYYHGSRRPNVEPSLSLQPLYSYPLAPKVEECATEGCEQPAGIHFIRGDVGSHYCIECYKRVQRTSVASLSGDAS